MLDARATSTLWTLGAELRPPVPERGLQVAVRDRAPMEALLGGGVGRQPTHDIRGDRHRLRLVSPRAVDHPLGVLRPGRRSWRRPWAWGRCASAQRLCSHRVLGIAVRVVRHQAVHRVALERDYLLRGSRAVGSDRPLDVTLLVAALATLPRRVPIRPGVTLDR